MRMLDDSDLLNGEERVPIKSPRKFGCQRHWRTAYNWAMDGLKSNVTGQVEYLESMMEGGSRVTTRAAYHRFLKRLNGVAT